MGWLMVSFVGVIADFASQRIGPRPITISATSSSACALPTPRRMLARRHSAGEISPP